MFIFVAIGELFRIYLFSSRSQFIWRFLLLCIRLSVCMYANRYETINSEDSYCRPIVSFTSCHVLLMMHLCVQKKNTDKWSLSAFHSGASWHWTISWTHMQINGYFARLFFSFSRLYLMCCAEKSITIAYDCLSNAMWTTANCESFFFSSFSTKFAQIGIEFRILGNENDDAIESYKPRMKWRKEEKDWYRSYCVCAHIFFFCINKIAFVVVFIHYQVQMQIKRFSHLMKIMFAQWTNRRKRIDFNQSTERNVCEISHIVSVKT